MRDNYKSILEAINKAVYTVLSTDIQDLDIDFNTSDINNQYLMDITLTDLYNIFKNNCNNIFKLQYNTLNSISLILDDNSETSLFEYNDNLRPVFLKISNDELKNNNSEILIAVDLQHYMPSKFLEWSGNSLIQTNEYLIEDVLSGDIDLNASSDYTGYENSLRIHEFADYKHTETPAINYCLLLSIRLNTTDYQGYLPAYGQLKIIFDYIDMINYIFEKINTSPILSSKEEWWSSTELDDRHAWYMTADRDDNTFVKRNAFNVLPLFKKIN